jgi:hypothetical protein
MFPLSPRVLFPAIVALVSGLWALTEWQAERALAEPLEALELDAEALELDAEALEARNRREAARLELAERKLKLAETREARLARRADSTGTSG